MCDFEDLSHLYGYIIYNIYNNYINILAKS